MSWLWTSLQFYLNASLSIKNILLEYSSRMEFENKEQGLQLEGIAINKQEGNNMQYELNYTWDMICKVV